MSEVDLEEGTYEIVTAGNYSQLIVNQGGENEEGTIEYLDPEVVEEISDDYYSTVDESQDNVTFDNKKIYTAQEVYLARTTDGSCGAGDDDSVGSSERKRKRSEEQEQNKEPIRKSQQFLRVREMSVENGRKNIFPVKITEDGAGQAKNPFILQVDSELSKGTPLVKPTVNGESNSTRETRPASDDKNNIDIFFKSMASTVSNLPLHVQAKIKMDVCKVIAMAEIKYCTDQDQS